MQTITIKLPENEAEALRRLAYCYGMSENQLFISFLSREYDRFLSGGYMTQPTPGINEISGNYAFPFECIDFIQYYKTKADPDTPKPYAEDLRRVLLAFDYAIEHATKGIELANLERKRLELLQMLEK